MEEAIRLTASAVGISIFVGTDYEKESLLNLSKLVDEGERYGIPVMAVTAVGKELEKRDARYLALSSRIAAELGARVVKTYWCQDFDKVTRGCPVPVIMAGGPQVDTELEVFEFVYDGMQKGAIGVNLGRNIWQNDFPVAMIKAIRAIVHQNASPKQAQDVYDTVKRGDKCPTDTLVGDLYLKQLKDSGFELRPTNWGPISVFYKNRRCLKIWPSIGFVLVHAVMPEESDKIKISSEKEWEAFLAPILKVAGV